MMKTTRELTKGTKELLIVTSIAILAGFTLLVFDDQGKMPTVIEQGQGIESRGLPNQAPIELMGYGNMYLVSGAELRNYLKSLPRTVAAKVAMLAIKSMCPECKSELEWLDAAAKRYNEMSFREPTRSIEEIEQYGKL